MLVVGHFGGRNAGDEAMLLALVRAAPDIEFVVSTKSPGSQAFPGNVVEAQRGIWSDCRLASRCSSLVVGGGTHLHDSFPFPRILYHYGSLLRYLLLSLLARLNRRPVLHLGVGVGPLRTRVGRTLGRLVLRSASTVVVRDSLSFACARSLTEPDRVTLGFDLVGLEPELHNFGTTLVPDRPKVAVSVARHPKPTGPGSTQDWDKLANALDIILRRRSEIQLQVFVFSGETPESDYPLAARLIGQLHEHRSRVELFDQPDCPEAIEREFSSATLVIGARFHSAIFSYLLERPLLVIPYHAKLRNFLAEAGYSDTNLLDLDGSAVDVADTIEGHIDDCSSLMPKRPTADARAAAAENLRVLSRSRSEAASWDPC